MTDPPQDDVPTLPADAGVPPPRVPDRRLGIVNGIGLVFAGHVLLVGVASVVSAFGPALSMLGVTQLVYVIPGIIWAHVKVRRHVRLGIIIGAAVTFLLNAACWGVVAIALSSIH